MKYGYEIRRQGDVVKVTGLLGQFSFVNFSGLAICRSRGKAYTIEGIALKAAKKTGVDAFTIRNFLRREK